MYIVHIGPGSIPRPSKAPDSVTDLGSQDLGSEFGNILEPCVLLWRFTRLELLGNRGSNRGQHPVLPFRAIFVLVHGSLFSTFMATLGRGYDSGTPFVPPTRPVKVVMQKRRVCPVFSPWLEQKHL